MAAPTIRPYNGVVPQRSQAPSEFANNADDWVAYQSPLAADYNALGDYVDVEAATIEGLADDAATSETNAATSASNASTSESNASTSETNAATSASNASTSETNAATSATNAANSFDSFDDRYLGAKISDPTVDNDGDALLTGALYFNSSTNNMRVYLGSAWANITNVTGSVDINGGTIDGTAIGETTKSTGKFTSLEADNISAYGASLIDDADATAARTTLGLGTAAVKNVNDMGALGTGVITATADAVVNGLTVGRGAGNVDSNTASGVNALSSNTTGDFNTVSGVNALRRNTTGAENTASGEQALRDNTTGFQNTASGRGALQANTTGAENTAIGRSALISNSTGNLNIAIGRSALQDNSTGSGNTGISPRKSSGTYAPVFNPTTENNRFCMGSTGVTNAYIQVAWTVVSDERDKAEFAPVPHGLDFVNQLKPTAFKYKKSREYEEVHGMVRYGFIAQEVLAIEGDNPVIVDNEDSEKLRMVETSLIPVLVNAINELTARVAILEGK